MNPAPSRDASRPSDPGGRSGETAAFVRDLVRAELAPLLRRIEDLERVCRAGPPGPDAGGEFAVTVVLDGHRNGARPVSSTHRVTVPAGATYAEVFQKVLREGCVGGVAVVDPHVIETASGDPGRRFVDMGDVAERPPVTAVLAAGLAQRAPGQEYAVFVRSADGTTVAIQSSERDTGAWLTAAYAHRVGRRAREVVLMCHGKQINPYAPLAEMGILREATVHSWCLPKAPGAP